MNEQQKQQLFTQMAKSVIDQFPSEGLTVDEVVFREDGKILIDRRKKIPQATPFVVGEWR